MNRFSFWQKWLFGVSLLVTLFGVLMAFLSGTVFFDLFNSRVNPVFWGSREAASDIKVFQQWIYGVLGATVAGWGVIMAFLAHYPFKQKEKWAWNALLAGLIVWFVIDTSCSWYFKAYFNVGFNVVLFVLVLLPLVFTRGEFGGPT